MVDNRTGRAKKNIVVSLSSQIVVLLCGIVIPRAMIGAFGSEAYGTASSITQFLAYITLLEGGIGGVARAVLYKPLAENDKRKISAIMAEISRFFICIGLIFVVYVAVLACTFHSISRVECMDWITTVLLVLVISISTFGQYFIGISNTVLLQAAQKSYVTNAVSTVATIVNAISTVALINLGCSLIFVKLASSLIFFSRPVFLWLYVKKQYQLPKSEEKGKNYLEQKWSGLGQHLAYFLHSNTDVVVLTLFSNLRMVAVYSVYNMIISHVQSLTLSFISGMEALFGEMLARNEHNQLHRTFNIYETLISVISTVMFSTTMVLVLPFIRLYTAGITDANYQQPLFAALLILSALCYCLRIPYHAVVIAAGHFKQTAGAAYGEAVVNIALSILLVSRFGLPGVAIGTLTATCFRFVYYVVYLSKHIFFRRINLFLKRVIVNATSIACNCAFGSWIISFIEISNYIYWVLGGILVAITSIVTTGVMNYLVYQDEFKEATAKFRRKVR